MNKQKIIELIDGEFEAYLVIEDPQRPISFGGMRVDTSVTLDMVVDLAFSMNAKLAGHGSPVGGAKAGLKISPTDSQLKKRLQQFAEKCSDVLTKSVILGKDMGAQQWMLNEIYAHLGQSQLSLINLVDSTEGGQAPTQLFELNGYIKHMTGKGIFWAIEQALGGKLAGANVLIQGVGAVGQGVAWHLQKAGANVIGISDRNTTIMSKYPINVDALLSESENYGLIGDIQNLSGCTEIDRDALLYQDADVLVLAAGSYLVTEAMANQIKVPLIVEGANMALQQAAREALLLRSVRVVPDVVANSSSAALVGHQLATANTMDFKLLWKNIEASIKRNTDLVQEISLEFGVDSKTAFKLLQSNNFIAPCKRDVELAEFGS